MEKFELVSQYTPNGDQPEAIKELVEGIKEGKNIRFAWRNRYRKNIYDLQRNRSGQ